MSEVFGPDPVDVNVGNRMREIRKLRGLSQQALAESIGVTFQQVQKYERGSNRVSASMLYRTAETLGVTISDFFEGLPPTVKEDNTALDDTRLLAMRAVSFVPAVVKLPELDAESRRYVNETIDFLVTRNKAAA